MITSVEHNVVKTVVTLIGSKKRITSVEHNVVKAVTYILVHTSGSLQWNIIVVKTAISIIDAQKWIPSAECNQIIKLVVTKTVTIYCDKVKLITSFYVQYK